MDRRLLLRLAAASVLAAFHPAMSGQSNAGGTERHLLELLQKAKPAPAVEIPDLLSVRRVDDGDVPLVKYNVESGVSRTVSRSAGRRMGRLAEPEVAPNLVPTAAPGANSETMGRPDDRASRGDSDELRGDTPSSGATVSDVTASPVEYPQENYPFTSIYQLLLEFPSGGSYVYLLCSAFAVGPFHLLTAGTCIYNHDPNQDGDSSDRGFATQVWAWAAQSNSIPPYRYLPGDDPQLGVRTPWADHPFGEAKAVNYWTYQPWRDSADPLYNVAYIALNRRDGEHTGWMGRETNVQTAGLNYAGYPVAEPLPPNNVFMIRGYDADNVIAYDPQFIIVRSVDLPGMNGMPYWRFSDGSRWVQGWSGNLYKGAPAPLRLTNAFFDDINFVMGEDERDDPPIARPDLTEFLFARDSVKNINRGNAGPHLVAPGDKVRLDYNVFNSGFADSGDVFVDFFLSTNNYISWSDRRLGGASLANLPAYTYATRHKKLAIPRNATAGTYFVGWIMSSVAGEYSDENNTGVVDILGGVDNPVNESILVVPFRSNVTLGYAGGKLKADYVVSTPRPVTWRSTVVTGGGLGSLFETSLPITPNPASVSKGFPLQPSGNVGVVSTLGDGGRLVAADWATADTAPPTNVACTLQAQGRFEGGNLISDMTLSLPKFSVLRWKVWRFTATGQDILLDKPVVGSGAFNRTVSVSQQAGAGRVALLAVATSSSEGIVCSSFIKINTGD